MLATSDVRNATGLTEPSNSRVVTSPRRDVTTQVTYYHLVDRTVGVVMDKEDFLIDFIVSQRPFSSYSFSSFFRLLSVTRRERVRERQRDPSPVSNGKTWCESAKLIEIILVYSIPTIDVEVCS